MRRVREELVRARDGLAGLLKAVPVEALEQAVPAELGAGEAPRDTERLGT